MLRVHQQKPLICMSSEIIWDGMAFPSFGIVNHHKPHQRPVVLLVHEIQLLRVRCFVGREHADHSHTHSHRSTHNNAQCRTENWVFL